MLDILNKINQPEDLRNIEINDLEKLSEEHYAGPEFGKALGRKRCV